MEWCTIFPDRLRRRPRSAAGGGIAARAIPQQLWAPACSAVTAADLERALGRQLRARTRGEARGAESTCDYGAGNAVRRPSRFNA